MFPTLDSLTRFRPFSHPHASWGAIALGAAVGLGLVLPLTAGNRALAQESEVPFWQQTGQLTPALNEYSLDLIAGQVISIRMTSDEIDPMVTLLGPSGEFLAFNDDAEGTLNSRLVFRAPFSGRYTIQTQAYGGGQGRYALRVTVATPYEVFLYDAELAEADGNFDEAIRALSSAIRLDPDQPSPYAQRGFLQIRRFYTTLLPDGLDPDNLPSIPPTVLGPALADLRTAADLYETQGDEFSASYLRAEATFFETGEYPQPETETLP